jgi:predicted lysophospholipase L1 biosynthesis ABC-type transport system permease subunit
VSTNFFTVLGLTPLAGRLFDPKVDDETKPNVVVVNASAARALGYATPQAAVGQLARVGNGPDALSARIVGVAPDIRYESLRQRPQPMMYLPSAETTVLTIKGGADHAVLEREVDALQRQYFPTDPVRVRRMADYYAENYLDDLRVAKLLGLSALTAIAIAAFGIYVLSAHNVQRLTRQIVLRKLYGAGRGAIAALVAREVVILIGVGALLGLPLAALSNHRYLAGFVERAPIGGWTLLAALLVAVLVTFVSTLRHALAAVKIAPAKALRDL